MFESLLRLCFNANCNVLINENMATESCSNGRINVESDVELSGVSSSIKMTQPDTRLHVYSTDTGRVISHEFGEGRVPVAHSWDADEPKLLQLVYDGVRPEERGSFIRHFPGFSLDISDIFTLVSYGYRC